MCFVNLSEGEGEVWWEAYHQTTWQNLQLANCQFSMTILSDKTFSEQRSAEHHTKCCIPVLTFLFLHVFWFGFPANGSTISSEITNSLFCNDLNKLVHCRRGGLILILSLPTLYFPLFRKHLQLLKILNEILNKGH